MLGTYSDGLFAMQVSVQDVDAKALQLGRAAGPMVRGNFLQVHPVALYETVILFVLLMVLMLVWKANQLNGVVMSVYLIGYGLMVFGMEFIRLDSQKIMGSRFSIEHIAAAGMVLLGLLILTEQIKKLLILRKAQPKNLSGGKKNK